MSKLFAKFPTNLASTNPDPIALDLIELLTKGRVDGPIATFDKDGIVVSVAISDYELLPTDEAAKLAKAEKDAKEAAAAEAAAKVVAENSTAVIEKNKEPKESKLKAYNDLKKQAKALGIKVEKGTAVDDLKALIEKKQAASN